MPPVKMKAHPQYLVSLSDRWCSEELSPTYSQPPAVFKKGVGCRSSIIILQVAVTNSSVRIRATLRRKITCVPVIVKGICVSGFQGQGCEVINT